MATRTFLVAALLSTLAVAPEREPASEGAESRIVLEVSELNNDAGRIVALLYTSATGFPRDTEACDDYRTAEISGGKARTSFSNLPAGTYAVLVFHDEDRNGKLKTNFIGMPKEGVGVTNNGSGLPRFSKAKFEVSAGAAVTKKVRINYL
ncbi:hypothetical protein PPSIR1_41449 [Plesiocystis pacifica SIR-1]|uniref:DUF2141 domain-containing protein n=1 Tax=Plesiocystis pacifica SIR-1 TaxID=391625 RepID=A6GDH8_9BACT|nr:DUF2141 domain-containing protein [Plesiocystis pacifica]EDM76090.1 hypothetical protein PPSIR1_41449 [Plesiocystis pacifica SIR-1]